MVVQQKRMTVEEFMALPDDGNRHELVRGELRVMPPPKGVHGFVEIAILAAIDRYLCDRATALGWESRQGLGARNALVGRIGGGELGLHFAVPDDPHMIRGADGVYIPPGSEYWIVYSTAGCSPRHLQCVHLSASGRECWRC